MAKKRNKDKDFSQREKRNQCTTQHDNMFEEKVNRKIKKREPVDKNSVNKNNEVLLLPNIT